MLSTFEPVCIKSTYVLYYRLYRAVQRASGTFSVVVRVRALQDSNFEPPVTFDRGNNEPNFSGTLFLNIPVTISEVS